MNIKASYKYQVSDNLKATITFYAIFTVICICLSIISILVSSNPDSAVHINLGGGEFTAIIFFTILGICSFKESFHMLLQNSISRKSYIVGKILSFATAALAASILDKVISLISRIVNNTTSDSTYYETLFEKMFGMVTKDYNIILIEILSLVLCFFLYFLFVSLGALISIIFYRLNKTGQLLVGIGTPVIFVYTIPILDGIFNEGRLIETVFNFIVDILGIRTGEYGYSFLTFTVCIIVNLALTWLLLRRASIKKKN